jgi:hypothetical protein
MKIILILFLFIFFVPVSVLAGEIYGNINARNIPLSNIRIQILNRNNQLIATIAPGRNGYYHRYLNTSGRYILKVTYNGISSNPVTIYSYRDPVRCNLIFERVTNTELRLRRV